MDSVKSTHQGGGMDREGNRAVGGANASELSSAKLLGAIVQSLPQALLVTDSAARMVVTNSAAALLHGYASGDEMPARMDEYARMFDVRRADGSPLPSQEWPVTRALAGETVRDLVLRVTRRDTGCTFVGSFSASPLEGAFDREHLALVSIHDLTQTERAEAALRRSEDRFRRLADSGSFGLVIADGMGRVTYMNPSLQLLLGYDAGFVSSGDARLEALTAPEFAELHERAMSQVMRSGRSTPHELAYLTRDGRRVPVVVTLAMLDDGGERLPVLAAYVLDLTPLRLAQAALRDNERRLRELMTSLPHLLWTTRADGRWDHLSEQWVQYTGATAAESLEYGWLERVHPDDRDAVRHAWDASVLSANPYRGEFRIRGADGAHRWFKTVATPMIDATGRVARWFGSSTDIEDQVRARETLRREGQRKSEFLAVLSHELRNPLAPIRNSLHVLRRTDSGSPLAIRAGAVVDRQLSHLERLVEDLLDLTRIDSDKVRLRSAMLDLPKLVRRTVDDHASLFDDAGVELRCNPGPGGVWVNGDETRLAQVFGNLLQNAVRFTPRGGHVSVEVEPTGDRKQVTVRVSDDGAGMDPQLLARLFTPFSQADTSLDRSRGGLGLGLALVKGLVERHGGSVRAASEGIGRGSIFEVSLPVQTDTETAAAWAGDRAEDCRRRVLVIEDNPDAADSLRDLLELCGHEVQVAHDGPSGLRTARAFMPEVVLCDIGLPSMDGYEVAAAFRSDPQLRAIRMVALTGYALQEDQRKATAAGFDCHVAKPPDLERLREILSGGNDSPPSSDGRARGLL